MENFEAYLSQITRAEHRARMVEILDWTEREYPSLDARIAWKQPMFTEHGTFIIGFSVSEKHVAVSPEYAAMEHFRDTIQAAGCGQSKMLFRIGWEQPVPYSLLREIIDFNRLEKADCKTFWRK